MGNGWYKAKILIVDDEPAVCDLLSEYLAVQGYLCATASDGPEALAKLERQGFDLK